VCQQLFSAPSMPKKYHIMEQQQPFIADRNMYVGHASNTMIELSPTIVFLMVALIIILLVYIIRNISK
jgi:hypothetical protein